MQDYTPTSLMAPNSHYDKQKADYAVSFIECLHHTKGSFFTESGFDDGNLMYYTVQGNRHDYQYTYEYVYNGLQRLF